MKREEALALLKEIVTIGIIDADWVSLDKRKTDSYEVHIKGEIIHQSLKPIIQKHNLAVRDVNGVLVIYSPNES